MPKSISILYLASEAEPFAKTGGLADVAGSFPQVIKEMGHDIRVFLPKYGFIGERKFNIYDVIRLRDIPISIGGTEVHAHIRSSFITNQKIKVQVYLFDLPKYFNRQGLYFDPNSKKDYKDNDERFISFCRGALEMLKRLGWKPDVIHCNDWQTGLVPAYLKTLYANDPFFSKIKTVFTIHNLAYQGSFPKESFTKTGLPDELFSENGVANGDCLNFMKSGIQFADLLTTVSKKYAEEICSLDDYGAGLKDILNKRKKDLHGILNGVDYSIWDPQHDELIPQKYSVKTIEDKKENKKALLQTFKLPYNEKIPVIGMITRLVEQKGLDLLADSADELMKKNVQLVILGSGERKYQTLLSKISSKFSNKIGVKLSYDNTLAHLIEAGSDMFLMPSRYEPCGMNQIYSMRYGTIPIVRATGGLDDTVQEFNQRTKKGTGFKFEPYNGKAMLDSIETAIKIYKNEKLWTKLMFNAISVDFSWENSVKQYIALYKKLLKS